VVNKNSAVALGNTETVNSKMSRFEQFGVQTCVSGILLKKRLLFDECLCKIMLLDIRNKSLAKRKNSHKELVLAERFEKYEDSFNPCSKLFRKSLL